MTLVDLPGTLCGMTADRFGANVGGESILLVTLTLISLLNDVHATQLVSNECTTAWEKSMKSIPYVTFGEDVLCDDR